jgi:hypothetical protein
MARWSIVHPRSETDVEEVKRIMETEKKTAARRTGTPKKMAASAPAPSKTRKKTPTAAKAAKPRHGIPPEERQRLIAQAAYLRAERRGFSGGSPEQDWLLAEAEIDSILMKRGGGED